MKRVELYLAGEQPCSYLPDLRARMALVSPETPMNTTLYSQLAHQGFRRSGDAVYIPFCDECEACIPVRLPVNSFKPNRAQSRVWRRNSDLVALVKPLNFQHEQRHLLFNYLRARHDETAEDSVASSYEDFLQADWVNGRLVEFRLEEKLLAVAVVDYLADGLSAVYTFYDIDAAEARSLGIYAVLWQIEEARRLDLAWLYLGFWVEHCRKMTYKNSYRPIDALLNGEWRRFEKGEKIASTLIQ
ncbi:arginyltransferase [Candidatus Methylospira mobilis]|uniref:Aspartate/glutamate leucyltransferase n=1 Tax=Candidatus Methylospira mobilis TaxID=1808979 RepID=A0A5Q0BH69_9GAMM|nr:arginyltransferase [Candidatus Methylospira mobilis]QFY42879.1 arginyltransferase [Candidatus Methylospira mobilis]WNV04062.1 arginyltransferase [Candidatus Methylospira mobilis]